MLFRRYQRRKKELSIVEKAGPILARLSREYSPEKTEEDYENIIKSMTSSRDLFDLSLKIWRRTLVDLEKEKLDDNKRTDSM